jgi:hypothetical protein
MTCKTRQIGSVPPVREDFPESRGHLEMSRRAALKVFDGAAIIGGASVGLWLNRVRATRGPTCSDSTDGAQG